MTQTGKTITPLARAMALAIALVPSTLGPLLLSTSPAASIQYRDGRVEFSYPPRLTDSYSTRNLAGESHPTYYLTIDFPAAAAEPLDRLVISLAEGYDPTFSYRLEATAAFVNPPQGRQPLPLGEVTEDRASQTLTLQFSPPLPPGQTITLALTPYRNPRHAGVYLFGVQAYPIGENPQPSFIGYARLSFYERDSYQSWP
jgi:hypothetical protein